MGRKDLIPKENEEFFHDTGLFDDVSFLGGSVTASEDKLKKLEQLFVFNVEVI
jgi:hypothetical protein